MTDSHGLNLGSSSAELESSASDILVSVVTVCFNEIESIGKCVASVLGQSYQNVEYIVIDGASTDGTKEELERHRSDLSCFVSEPDNGIYSAMNKALKVITGDIVYFLNADDYFYDDRVIEKVVDIFNQNNTADIVSGRVRFFNTPIRAGVRFSREDFSYPDKLTLYSAPIPQQCLFVKSELFNRYPQFNETYSICADYDWLIRMINNGVNILQVDDCFCHFDFSGISYTENRRRRNEKNRIIFRNSSVVELFIYGFRGILGRLNALFARS